MSTKDEPMPPEVRKVARLAIAMHLMHALLSVRAAGDIDASVTSCYEIADKLIEKAGL